MADATSEGVIRLIYRSRNRIVEDRRKVALGSLFSQARSNNKERNICGALLLSDNWFVQVLEAVVRRLYEKIEKDPRHEHVELLETTPIAERVFGRWAMAKVSEDGEPDITLIAHRDGIHRAHTRGTTPEQEEILSVMRHAARGDKHAV
ncbi:BLUF domain-containing protein [Pseudonocardia sp.]|uniref:BLUF domain-containing protein n=1 Tax=Pseudonocardia sp. TaxID=60912 RepID=UPI0026365617|nr:BLUF domain-containing protein [Pseudonocardia sp.]